jgi:glycosyltransferase involved in cell wall biosynthesis
MATQIAFRAPGPPLRPAGGPAPGVRSARPSRPRVSVVIPARNEAECIGTTVDGVADALASLDLEWEVIVIDDGSTDGTGDAVAGLDPSCHASVLRLSRNFGKEAAITAGLDHASGDVILCMDADGQHPVSLIPQMLERWREGYEMIYAVRTDRATESHYKRIGTRLFYKLMRSAGEIDIPPDAGDFRWMDRAVVEAIRRLPEHNRFMKGLYSWVGFRSIGIPFMPLARTRGHSRYSRLKLAGLAWKGITSFSVLPLRAASVVGAVLASLAFAYGTYEFAHHMLYGTDVPGWPTVVVGMMFFSGVQLLFIGILGEYLARVYDEVKGRPTYIVAEWRRAAADDSQDQAQPAPREHAQG